jgi:hypothetical protein
LHPVALSDTYILCRTPLDDGWAHCRDLYLTALTRQTTVPQVGFEPSILANERPQTHALDGTATGSIQYMVPVDCTYTAVRIAQAAQ